MQYGDTTIYPQKAAVFLGSNPENKDLPPPVVPGEKGKDLAEDVQVEGLPEGLKMFLEGKKVGTVQQRDADLLHFWHKVEILPFSDLVLYPVWSLAQTVPCFLSSRTHPRAQLGSPKPCGR